jgi:ABC-type sugar transport system substrate-binding protein
MQKFIEAIRTYWRISVSPLGAILIAIAVTKDVQELHHTVEWILVAFGGLITIYGAVQASEVTTSNKNLLNQLAETEKLKNDRVFLILSAFKDEFQSELNYHLLKIGTATGLSLQVFCPAEDFSADAQRIAQYQVIRNAGQYSGGLVIVSQFADDALPELEEFARMVRLPLVLVDHIPPKNGDNALLSSPDRVNWVTVSDTDGAEEAVRAVGEITDAPQQILVVAGTKKKDRQLSFEAGVKARWPKCVVTTDTDGGFNRQETEKVVRRRLTHSVERESMYDIIFCTTDTMTLGCLDAIKSVQWAGAKVPRVIGYDGIKATRDLILRGNTPLTRVVVQNVEEMADKAIARLMALKGATGHHDQPDSEPVFWVKPVLYPSSS